MNKQRNQLPLCATRILKLVHEHALAAAGVEYARRARQRRKIAPHRVELRKISGIELPVGRDVAVIVAAFGVLTRPRDG